MGNIQNAWDQFGVGCPKEHSSGGRGGSAVVDIICTHIRINSCRFVRQRITLVHAFARLAHVGSTSNKERGAPSRTTKRNGIRCERGLRSNLVLEGRP